MHHPLFSHFSRLRYFNRCESNPGQHELQVCGEHNVHLAQPVISSAGDRGPQLRPGRQAHSRGGKDNKVRGRQKEAQLRRGVPELGVPLQHARARGRQGPGGPLVPGHPRQVFGHHQRVDGA